MSRVAALLIAIVATLLPAQAHAAGDPLAAWKTAVEGSSTGQANVVYLGSSTTYGTGASSPDRRYVNVLTDRLRGSSGSVTRAGSTFPERNTTAGVHGYVSAAGGTTSRNYVNDTTRAFILWEQPSLIVHMIGSNDSIESPSYAVTVEEYEANVSAEIGKLDAGSKQPISHVLVHTYRRAGTSLEKWATYGAALERIAAARDNVTVVDISDEYEAADHIGSDPRDLIGVDGVHPTDAGHAYMAQLVGDALAPAQVAPVEPTPTPTPVPVPVPTVTPTVAAPVPAPVVTPAPTPVTVTSVEAPRRVRAVQRAGRTVVKWRGSADAYRVQCGKRAKVTDEKSATLRVEAARCKVRSIEDGTTSPWSTTKVTTRR